MFLLMVDRAQEKEGRGTCRRMMRRGGSGSGGGKEAKAKFSKIGHLEGMKG
jgi:hypothetical protein